MFASFGEPSISAAWDASKIGGRSSAYLDFPNCSRGELLEFPDLFVAKVDYKYHNFPFCSWVCLLSSILEGAEPVGDLAGLDQGGRLQRQGEENKEMGTTHSCKQAEIVKVKKVTPDFRISHFII